MGQCPAAPCSPGPFVLLLTTKEGGRIKFLPRGDSKHTPPSPLKMPSGQNRVFCYAGDHYGANRNSGHEISSSGPEMCTPLFLRPKSKLRRGSLRCGANRHSGREISNSGPEMCTPLFLRPKSKPAGREKPIRVAPIRVVTKYPTKSGRGEGVLDGQNRQSPIASDFGSRTQIAALFAILLYPNV